MDAQSRLELVDQGLVSIKSASAFLGVSIATLYSLMGRGELAFVKIGKSRRIPRKSLIELAAKNLVLPEN